MQPNDGRVISNFVVNILKKKLTTLNIKIGDLTLKNETVEEIIKNIRKQIETIIKSLNAQKEEKDTAKKQTPNFRPRTARYRGGSRGKSPYYSRTKLRKPKKTNK